MKIQPYPDNVLENDKVNNHLAEMRKTYRIAGSYGNDHCLFSDFMAYVKYLGKQADKMETE